MIWLSWRQLRTQAAVLYGGVAVLAAVFGATGPGLAHRYRTGGAGFLTGLAGVDTELYLLGILALVAAPAVIGMFWGAPLVTRELDAGTHRLIWNQTTTRTRWLLTKLGVTGLAAVAATGLLSLTVSWWAGPIDEAVGTRPGPGYLVFPRLSPEVFGSRGVVPLAYAAFFFVLGVTVGVLTRRTLPAMALFLAAFAVIQVVMCVGVRPHLVTPERVTTTITTSNVLRMSGSGDVTVAIDAPAAWIVSQHTVDAGGRPVHPPSWFAGCTPGDGPDSRACFERLTGEGYRQVVYFEPAGRFWALQWAETATYLVLTVLLTGFCVWWVRHRLA